MRTIVECAKQDGCQLCGSYQNLTMHHINPGDKKIDITQIIVHHGSITQLVIELEKCAVLCRRCHDKLHDRHQRWRTTQLTPIRVRLLGVPLPVAAYNVAHPVTDPALASSAPTPSARRSSERSPQ